MDWFGITVDGVSSEIAFASKPGFCERSWPPPRPPGCPRRWLDSDLPRADGLSLGSSWRRRMQRRAGLHDPHDNSSNHDKMAASKEVHMSWRFHMRLMRVSGLWPADGSTVGRRLLSEAYVSFSMCCFLLFYLSGAINAFFSGDVHDLGENVSVALTNTLSFVKMAPFVILRPRIWEAIDRMGRDLYSSAELLVEAAPGSNPVHTAVRRSRRVATGIVTLVLFTSISALMAPLAEFASHCSPSAVTVAPTSFANVTAANGDDADVCEPWAPRLPFGGWFPWDWTKFPAYPFTYLFQVVVNFKTALMAAATDSFFIALLHDMCAQFELLACALRDVQPSPARSLLDTDQSSSAQQTKVPSSRVVEEFPQMRLPQQLSWVQHDNPRDEHLLRCIIFHQQLLRYVNDMRWILRPVLFGETVVMMVVLCMITFHASMVPINSVAFVSFLAFYTIEMGQLLLYCWFCNDLKDQSEEVSSAVYSSDWITAEWPLKHSLMVFMQGSSSSVKMDALGFMNVDMDLFTNIIRASYSFYTVLTQMNDVEKK